MDAPLATLLRITFMFYILLFFSIKGAFSDKELRRGVWNGREAKVLAYNFPPMFTYKKEKDGNYTVGGMAKDLMDDAKDYMNISLKYVIVDQNEVNQYGLIRALLNHLDKKEIDIVPYMFDQTEKNLKHMELTIAIWISQLVLLQPWPKEKSRLQVTIRPFELSVWLCVLTSIAAFILFTTVFIKIERRINQVDTTQSFRETIYRQLEYVLTIIANQGNSVSYNAKTSFKILVGIWLLCMVVLVNAYSGVLTSLLTVPKLEPIVKNLQEIVENEYLELGGVTIERDSSRVIQEILDATTGYRKVLGDQIRQDPTLWATDSLAALENVVHRRCVYPGTKEIIGYIIREDTKANGRCRLTKSPEVKEYGSVNFQIGAPIGTPYAPAFNEAMLIFQASGIISLYNKRHMPTTNQCDTDVPPETKTRSLNVADLAPAFLILGIGLSLSILAFLIEILAKILKDIIFGAEMRNYTQYKTKWEFEFR